MKRTFLIAPLKAAQTGDGGEGMAAPNALDDAMQEIIKRSQVDKNATGTDFAPEPIPGFPVTGSKSEVYDIRQNDGVYIKDTEKPNAPGSKICGYLRPIAVTHDRDGGDYGLIVEFADIDGKRRTMPISMGEIVSGGSKLCERLRKAGVWVNYRGSGASPVNLYLNDFPLDGLPREVTVNRGGWSGDGFTCFVTRGGAIYPKGCKEIAKLSSKGEAPELKRRGTLEEWQALNKEICECSTRIAFAVAAALAAPLLQIVGGMNRTFSFTGESGKGKSTALLAAASVWGDSKYVAAMKGTGNGAEAYFQQYNNLPCIFDESSEADEGMAKAATYGNGNGRGRNRMTAEGKLRECEQWSNYTLIAGEGNIEELKRQFSRGRAISIKTGEIVRFLDIPICPNAPEGWGAFERLPEGLRDNETRRTEWIKARASEMKAFGHAGPAFLQKLVDTIEGAGLDAFQAEAREKIKAFKEIANQENQLDEQHKRALESFAIVAFAGELAISFGVLKWAPGLASAAAMACFKAWANAAPTITRRGKEFAGRVREDSGVRRSNYWSFRINNDNGTPPEGVGTNGAVGTLILGADNSPIVSVFTARQFAQLVQFLGDGLNKAEAKKALSENSMILRDGGEKGYEGYCKPQQKKPPFGIASKSRVLIVKLLEGEEAEAIAEQIKPAKC